MVLNKGASRRVGIGYALAVAVVLAAGLWWTMAPDAAPAQSTGGVVLATATPVARATPPQPMAAVPPAADPAKPLPDSLLSPVLLRVFDDLLGETSAKDKVGRLAEMHGQLRTRMPAGTHARAMGLIDRYIDYREALNRLGTPNPADPQSLARMYGERDRIRAIYFSDDEVAGLWQDGDPQDRYLLERSRILASTSLDATQRETALREAEARSFPAQELAARRESVQHLDMLGQTAEFEARGVGPQQRYEERVKSYGQEAAQRLGALDQQEAEWQTRLARVTEAAPAERERLVNQLFTEVERRRLDGALALQAQSRHSAQP